MKYCIDSYLPYPHFLCWELHSNYKLKGVIKTQLLNANNNKKLLHPSPSKNKKVVISNIWALMTYLDQSNIKLPELSINVSN